MGRGDPYGALDDGGLVRRCVAGEPGAYRALVQRHGRLAEAVVVRVLDERRPGELLEVPAILDALRARLEANEGAALRVWEGKSLRHYLAVLARQVASEHVQEETPTGPLIAALPTPAALFLDDLVGIEPAKRVAATLERLSPHVRAIVRLRLRGIGPADVAAAVGMPLGQVSGCLEKVATRLGEDLGDAGVASWRLILGCDSVEERVASALCTQDDEDFREIRQGAETTWRAVRERSFTQLLPLLPSCLTPMDVAAFVDGTLRGRDRGDAEAHLAACGRCVDRVAMLVLDMQALDPLREAHARARPVALAAACLGTTRFLPALILAEEAERQGEAGGSELVRLAQLGLRLEGGSRKRTSEPSRVTASMPVPSDDEAPLLATEALVLGDLPRAGRAIDDHMALSPLGARLRLLTFASGLDPAGARELAAELASRARLDPGVATDARTVLALREGDLLPAEILSERLRALLPDLVRLVVTRR